MYYDKKMTVYQIAELYNVNGSTISSNMKRMGYKLRQVGDGRSNSKYTVDVRFFDSIDTEEKAYIIGFILADGHISKQGSLIITLHKRDIDILEKIRVAMKSDYPIKPEREKYVSLIISSKTLCDKLNFYGFNNRKTYGFDFDKLLTFIPNTLIPHFIRGMFDGDGCIAYYQYPYMKKHSFHFGFTGLLNVVEYVYKYLDLHTKLTKETDLVYTCTTKDVNHILNIKNVLYNNATIFLQRKYKVFSEIEKIYEREFSK